jgi:nitrite reductase/ring-hydroxylating ferredoxin subunit
MPTRLTTAEQVHDDGSFLFTIEDANGVEDEVIVVPCDDGVEAWINRCPHEAQRFDTGRGVPMRDGEIICPKHGSFFDSCSGHCDNGEAAGTDLPSVGLAVTHGDVYLSDDSVTYRHDGGIDDGDDGPSSTSHLSF